MGESAITSPEPKVKLTWEERRIRREARREKQRGENVGRAAKMHKARMEAEQKAKEPDRKLQSYSQSEFQVGCSGWFYLDWR